MPIPTLFLHSNQLEYTSNTITPYYSYDIRFPDDIIIPANSAINVDFKIRVAMYCPNTGSRMYGLTVLPKDDIIDTPLVHALGCSSLTNLVGAVDIYIPIRNVTDTDYFIKAETCLFNLVFKHYVAMNVRIVDLDYPFMV